MASQTDFTNLLRGGDEEVENEDTQRKLNTQFSTQVCTTETFISEYCGRFKKCTLIYETVGKQ
jgi:hypothetical protein